MQHVNMHDAKSQLSKLVDPIQSGRETEITIARNGRPAAMLVPVRGGGHVIKLGVAEGRFTVPDDFDRDNDRIAALFDGGDRCD